MNIQGLANLIKGNLKHNAPAYLSAGACVGVISTAFYAARNHHKAKVVLDVWEEENGVSDNAKERIIDRIGVTWRFYIPTVVSGTATIACIVAANRAGNKQTAAAIAGAAVVRESYDIYREKIREVMGEKKDQEILGKVAEEKLKDNPPPSIIAGSGHVLCCELFTGRYFNSDVESLRKAQNTLNQKLLAHDFATLADFQYMIGLTPTSHSTDIGWTSSRLMELEISAILTNDEKPCLAFDYNYTVPV